MRREILAIIKCPSCDGESLSAQPSAELYGEWRQGTLSCSSCKREFPIDEGIGNFLVDPSPEILKEQQGSSSEIRIKTNEDEAFQITPESIERFSSIFTSMPRGDGSYFFTQGGSFQNFAEGAHRFYELIDTFDITPGLRVLEIGAGFCWASREFADRGCDVVAVDITSYLKVADLYLKKGLFFERVYSDMDHLPFKDGSFDILFAAATIHHSSDLNKTFKELYRVLKKGGKLILLNECFIGLFEKPQKHDEDFAYNDNYYTLPQWKRAIRGSHFRNIRISYLSFMKDYVARKEARGTKDNFKLNMARKIVSHPALDRLISYLMLPHRILFRPKSVLIQAIK